MSCTFRWTLWEENPIDPGLPEIRHNVSDHLFNDGMAPGSPGGSSVYCAAHLAEDGRWQPADPDWPWRTM